MSLEELIARRGDLYADMRRMEKDQMGASFQWNIARVEYDMIGLILPVIHENIDLRKQIAGLNNSLLMMADIKQMTAEFERIKNELHELRTANQDE